jgi:undecaprenyl-diphosphatase
MTSRASPPANRPASALPLALLLAAPAVLLLGAAGLCLAADCRPGPFDAAGMALAARGQGPLTDAFFRALTWGGSVLVLGPLALVCAALAWRHLRSPRALFLPVALAGAALLAFAAKIAVDRERPAVAALIEMPADASFPSAHALQVSAFVTAWLLAPGRDRRPPRLAEVALGIVLVASVAWSRLHLQVHYPSDILFGLAAGVLWVVSLRRLSVWRPEP